MTRAILSALGVRFDSFRAIHGRDNAIADLAAQLAASRPRARAPIATDPAAEALVAQICQELGGANWGRLHKQVSAGTLLTQEVNRARQECAWVLHGFGYSDVEIGALLNRERSTVTCARKVFAKRLAADQILAARMARIVGEKREAAVAA